LNCPYMVIGMSFELGRLIKLFGGQIFLRKSQNYTDDRQVLQTTSFRFHTTIIIPSSAAPITSPNPNEKLTGMLAVITVDLGTVQGKR